MQTAQSKRYCEPHPSDNEIHSSKQSIIFSQICNLCQNQDVYIAFGKISACTPPILNFRMKFRVRVRVRVKDRFTRLGLELHFELGLQMFVCVLSQNIVKLRLVCVRFSGWG